MRSCSRRSRLHGQHALQTAAGRDSTLSVHALQKIDTALQSKESLQVNCFSCKIVLTSFFPVLLMSDLWMWGMTPPPAMVACGTGHKIVIDLSLNKLSVADVEGARRSAMQLQ